MVISMHTNNVNYWLSTFKKNTLRFTPVITKGHAENLEQSKQTIKNLLT